MELLLVVLGTGFAIAVAVATWLAVTVAVERRGRIRAEFERDASREAAITKGRAIAGVIAVVARSRGRMLRELAARPVWEGDSISVRGTVPGAGRARPSTRTGH